MTGFIDFDNFSMFNESLVRHDKTRSNSGRSCGHQISLAARSNQLRLDLGCDMSGFSKLHSSLTASSLWNEPDKTRIVFITMLSMADSNGDVKASVVGLAHQARESLPDTEAALKTLLSPDPHSGRKEMEGRRIVEIEGGWHLVTHEFYRELGMSEETKRYWRERKRALREKKSKNVSDKSRKSRTVKDSLGSLVSVSASDSVKKEEGTREKKPLLVPTAEDIYNAYPLKVGRPDAIREIKKCFGEFGQSFLLERTVAFAKARNGDTDFCPHPSTWFHQHRFNDDPETWKPKQPGQKKKPLKPWEKIPQSKPRFNDLYPQ